MEKKSKTVNLTTGDNQTKNENKPENDKLSYEELEKIANELNNKCKQFYQQLIEAQNIIDNFNEIGMFLSLLKRAEYFEPTFVDRISNKIQETVNKALDAAEKRDENQESNN